MHIKIRKNLYILYFSTVYPVTNRHYYVKKKNMTILILVYLLHFLFPTVLPLNKYNVLCDLYGTVLRTFPSLLHLITLTENGVYVIGSLKKNRGMRRKTIKYQGDKIN